MKKLSFLLGFALLLQAQQSQSSPNPYLPKKKQRSHETTTHKKPVPKNQLLPPITKKKEKPKYKIIVDEDGNQRVVPNTPTRSTTPPTKEELMLQEAKYYCIENGGAWCWKLGMYFYEGQITKQNYNEAYNAFEAGCLTKNGGACYSLGFMYEFGRGEVEQSDKKALELYLKSCNYGYDRGCQAYRALKK